MRLRRPFVFLTCLLPIVGVILPRPSVGDTTHNKDRVPASVARALEPPKSVLINYREDVEPFLRASCGSCHSTDKHSSGFVVETPEALLRGGSKFSAKVVVPGKAAQSALVAYLRGKNQPRMPLNQQPLTEEQIGKVEAWINQGARVEAVKIGWPYTPPAAHLIPPVKNASWPRNPIDNFVLARLEAAGLQPSSPAPKVTLLRRAYADLVGVPPTPEQTQAFITDSSPNAFEKIVDRLLDDPRYGERWGRHWLDLVRFAETHGFENDGIRPHAWRYRDYVIKSFNDDKPYDRFLKEQIAGDELYPDNPDAIIATGFARLGPWDELSREPEQRWQDYLNDVTDTTGSVMLGLTVGCARCHNHKYDRITQSDYYRLQAFFVGTKWVDARLPGESDQSIAGMKSRLTVLKQKQNDLRGQFHDQALAAKQARAKPGEKVEINDRDVDRFIKQKGREETDRTSAQIRDLESRIAPFEPVVEAINDGGKSAPVAHILLRGSLSTPGKEVKAGFIAALCGGEEKPAEAAPPANLNSTGRRTALANWIGSAGNPMTARVIVNRLWQHHFGRGLVGTPSDFGKNGDKVTHPELLDWLALRFVQDGWSLKKLHKLMLMSAAYQQSTTVNAKAVRVDPDNHLLWRMNRIRLEGEALRDSILAVSGRLNPQMGGPSVYPKVSDEVLSTGSTHKWGTSPEDQGLRRTIYVFQRRSLVLPIVEVFDGADMTNTCPRRATTTIAPQALAMFNGEFTRTESGFFADRVIRDAGNDREKQVDLAYRIALSRPPTAQQKTLALEFMRKQTSLHLPEASQIRSGTRNAAAPEPDAAIQQTAERAALAELCHVLINTNEFMYLD
jgi:hypothetical protein